MRSQKPIQRARTLRADSTDAESWLWLHLRNRRLLGFKFRRQHPVQEFIADFACLEVGLIVELDGRQHLDEAKYDERRTQALVKNGFRVVRFWNDDVLRRTDVVLEEILRNLQQAPKV
jgi:very-short-patch-repair endonuclease